MRELNWSFRNLWQSFLKINDRKGGSAAAIGLAKSFKSDGAIKSAIKFALISGEWASEIKYLYGQILAADLLSQLYEESGQEAKAFNYLKQYQALKDKNEKLNNASKRSELEVQAVLKKRQREIELLETETQLKEQENKTQRIWIFSIAGALASLILLTFILVRNNREKQKTNSVLASTLKNLKATQAQLIQSEKMASLGELTAGIAHEIQNPLNFVNNFSDVSGELIEEVLEELDKNDIGEAKDILSDLKGNLVKISHHGGRASGIVKGMLDHSRASTGEKVPTDINGLCDEYLRLSYHGLRAKDKSFNSSFETHFEENLPEIQVIPQDIGRVLLNVFNNAFYAVNRKDQTDPKVTVTTSMVSAHERRSSKPARPFGGERRSSDAQIEICIKDNGIGMSKEVKEKVFQPFFTTKPTGKGTGLGMSISYDIITKGHRGDIKVESTKGVGTTFTISLPANSN